MKKILLLFLVLSTRLALAQTDSIPASSAGHPVPLRDSVAPVTDTVRSLLPEKMLFTQRLLWGEKGLLRDSKSSVTEAQRDKKMDLRSKIITAHQYLGYATLAGLTGECVVGLLLNSGKRVGGLHEGLAGFTNFVYGTTATLAFFSPPRPRSYEGGWNKTKIHRALSVVHLTGMIATNVLAGMLENNRRLVTYHKIAAITTFASYAAATLVIKL
jgi:hypothetical protein